MNAPTLQERQFAMPINWLLAKLQRFEWPGKHRFYKWICKNHPNRLITHKISECSFILPVDEWCFWLEKGPENYYLDGFQRQTEPCSTCCILCGQ